MMSFVFLLRHTSLRECFTKDSLTKQEFTGYDMYDLIMDKFDVSRVCVSGLFILSVTGLAPTRLTGNTAGVLSPK